MNPRPESRIKSLENRSTAIEAGIEELSSDQAESNKALFAHVQNGFKQVHDFVQERFEEVNSRLDQMQSDITSIKSTQEQILTLLQQKPE